MVEPVTCSECGKTVRDLRALQGHSRLKHGISSTSSLEGKHIESAQNSTELKYKGGNKPVSEEKPNVEEKPKSGICPTCQQPRLSIQDQINTALAEQARKAELKKVQAELAEALHEIPDFSDILKHCESGVCPGHAKQLQDYREKVAIDVVTTLGKPEHKPKVLELMKVHGIDEMPHKITISGIKRG